MTEKIIQIKNLSAWYGQNNVLNNISFDVLRGDYVGIAGPNGSGKTTLIKSILRLIPSDGEILFLGKRLPDYFKHGRIGYLPQRSASIGNPLFPASVREVVSLGLLAQKSLPRRITKNDHTAIDEVLERLNITDLRDRLIGQLSGGQQQRVFLARALVSKPDLIILDEPSTALDPVSRVTFFELVNRINREENVTVMFITHDTAHIGHYAKKLLYLDKKIIFYGNFSEFCSSIEMTSYFGEHQQHLICHQH